MADFTLQITVAATVGGKSFSWVRTGTITDIESVVTAALDGYTVGSGANTLARENTSVGNSDTPITTVGMSVGLWAGTGNYGAVSVQAIDPTAAASFYAHLPMGMPFIIYNGENFDGSFNQSNTANNTPDYSLTSLNVTALSGLCSAQGMACIKPIS